MLGFSKFGAKLKKNCKGRAGSIFFLGYLFWVEELRRLRRLRLPRASLSNSFAVASTFSTSQPSQLPQFFLVKSIIFDTFAL